MSVRTCVCLCGMMAGGQLWKYVCACMHPCISDHLVCITLICVQACARMLVCKANCSMPIPPYSLNLI